MNYDMKFEGKGQEISLKDRKKLEITGVKKIDSLNSEEFLIETTLGLLLVRGAELEMQHLDIEKGILWITGTVYLLEYIDGTKSKKEKSSFIGKVFK